LPAATLANTTGAIGELIVNSNNYTLTVHDGALPGGYALLNSATDSNIDQTARNTANTNSNNISIIQGVDTTQNTRLNSIETINANQNTSISIIQGVDTTQNTNITTATNLAQAAFNAANSASSGTIDQYARNTANTNSNNISIIQGVNTTQNTNITTATNLAQAAFNTANTANTRTVINGLGNSKLDFNTYGANSAYLTTTDNDSTALFMGTATADLYADTSVSIRANTGGTPQAWTFGAEGTLTFPNSSIQNTAFTGTAIDQVARNSANAAAQTVPQNAQSTNYVLQLTDAGKHIYYTQASNTILYIPTTSNVAFSNGTTIMIVSRKSSDANVTVSPNTGVTMFLAGNTTSASRNVTTYGMASLIQVAANTWFINGTGVS
jgi:hypothetical protein